MKYGIVALVVGGLILISVAAILARRLGVTKERIAATALITLAGMALAGTVGILFGGAIAPPVQTDPWFKTYQTAIIGLIAVAVTSSGAVIAWLSVQQQIANQRSIFEEQQDGTRKQRRLDYLRQYLPQVEEALFWVTELQKALLTFRFDLGVGQVALKPTNLPMMPHGIDPILQGIPDLISRLRTMPKMPFYPGNSPVVRRDSLVSALEELGSVLSESKSTGAEGSSSISQILRTNLYVASRKVQIQSDWESDEDVLRRIQIAKRAELLALEEAIEFKIKTPFDIEGWNP